jgi:hypothetical protein
MNYKLPETVGKIVEPPFTIQKFHSSVEELGKTIDGIDELNALDSYMTIHVLASWISDHLNEINVLPSSYEEGKKDFMTFIQIFGRNGGVNSEFHTQPSNQSSENGTLVTPEIIFIDNVSIAEIYEMLEDDQDSYCERILEKVTLFKGKINARWYRGSIPMTPPHHCEE